MTLPTRPPDGGRAPVSCTYRTKAIGTVAELFVTDSASLVAASELLLVELDRIDRVASRFRDDSELSRLNASSGQEVPASADLLEAVGVALAMAEATDGLVDPTVGRAMHAIGYDRDIDEVRAGRDGSLPDVRPVPGWRGVEVDLGRGTISLPAGTSLDLGATAKALAADRAARTIADRTRLRRPRLAGRRRGHGRRAPRGGLRRRARRHLHALPTPSRPWRSAPAASPPRVRARATGCWATTTVHHLVDPDHGPACRPPAGAPSRWRRRPASTPTPPPPPP